MTHGAWRWDWLKVKETRCGLIPLLFSLTDMVSNSNAATCRSIRIIKSRRTLLASILQHSSLLGLFSGPAALIIRYLSLLRKANTYTGPEAQVVTQVHTV